MDEVFDSSLDGMGTDEFLKIIRYVIKDTNIFVISHKPEMHEKFESMIRFEKVKGFSRMVEQWIYQIGSIIQKRIPNENLNHRHCDKQKSGDKHLRGNTSRVLF